MWEKVQDSPPCRLHSEGVAAVQGPEAQLDSQLAQQGREMASLQDHYSDCLKQLQRVEKLGFQATLLPSPAYSLDTDHV